MNLNRSARLTAYTRRAAQIALLLLFIGTITLSVGLNLLLSITGVTAVGAGAAAAQTQDALTGYGLALSIVIYGLVTPLLEECVFRGMLYSTIYDHITKGDHKFLGRRFVIAAVLSSLLFAIYHLNLAQGIYAWMMGMIFCLAYECTGWLFSPWILHAACNIISLLLSQPANGTNAFTQLCTWPWASAFLAIAVAAMISLQKVLTR